MYFGSSSSAKPGGARDRGGVAARGGVGARARGVGTRVSSSHLADFGVSTSSSTSFLQTLALLATGTPAKSKYVPAATASIMSSIQTRESPSHINVVTVLSIGLLTIESTCIILASFLALQYRLQ